MVSNEGGSNFRDKDEMLNYEISLHKVVLTLFCKFKSFFNLPRVLLHLAVYDNSGTFYKIPRFPCLAPADPL